MGPSQAWKMDLFKRIVRSSEDTHGEKAPSNRTLTLRKSRNMGIWVVGTSNQLFVRGSSTEAKFSKR